MRRVIVGSVAAMVAVLGLVAASEAVSISPGCLAGPSTATCFRPGTVIDPPNNGVPIPPVIVEIVDSNGNAPGGTISLNMQANFGSATNFKIFYVAMNLDPAITPSALSFVLDGTSTETSPVTITLGAQDAQSAAPEQNFDVLFQFSASGPSARFTASETIGWTVTCDAAVDSDCTSLFSATSFDFLNTGADPDFRICTHVGGIGPNDDSNKVCGGAAEPPTTQVPEPGTLLVLGLGLTAAAAAARRKATN